MLPEKEDCGFVIKISIANTLSFWLATVLPYIVDPLLVHIPKYGARPYPHGWLIFPIGLILGIVTFFIMTRVQRHKRLFWNTLSFLLACLLALPLFKPIPHAYVAPVGGLCLLLSAITVWIHYQPIEVGYASDRKIDRTARLERVKEEILFWRGGMIAVLVAFLALLVGWGNALREGNLQLDPDPYEQSLLNNGAFILIVLTSIWVAFGPLAEAAKKRSEAQNLLLKIEA